jgi:ketosteroid isomerase-like protein
LQALDRWCQGDPSGFLDLSADDVVYFDPFVPRRLDGKEALARYYEGLRGKISADRYEILAPRFHAFADAVVLTYNFVSFSGSEASSAWNCTEVFALREGGWRLVQSHWSLTAK